MHPLAEQISRLMGPAVFLPVVDWEEHRLRRVPLSEVRNHSSQDSAKAQRTPTARENQRPDIPRRKHDPFKQNQPMVVLVTAQLVMIVVLNWFAARPI